MTIELHLVLEFLKIIKEREIQTGKIIPSEVERQCELKKIESGLQHVVYDENEKFCLDTGLILKNGNNLQLTEIGEAIIENKESREKINQIIIENCLLKSEFSNKIMPGLAQFHGDKENGFWYEKNEVFRLFDSSEDLKILRDVGLLVKDDDDTIKINSEFYQNETITGYRKKKKPISQKDLEAELRKSEETKKKIGLIAEKIVVNYERRRLEEEGCVEEAKRVEQISQDWANKGYDIESFDGKSDDLIPDRFIEVKGTTGKNFSIFWSQNEIEAAQELGVKYWIYFVREIDVENETAPNEPEMIPNAFYEIDPFDNDPYNKKFVKESESIHVTKRQEN
ncbi:MAG: hypothetical protein CL758_09030 [Chloroflexi bacterium]|nr:hypothetical protein [Chloroflexota bacterium]|tara:strand:+ start:4675 stop:5691 length:1017 start_codon:yes stop_codon:yes gene_type:complete